MRRCHRIGSTDVVLVELRNAANPHEPTTDRERTVIAAARARAISQGANTGGYNHE